MGYKCYLCGCPPNKVEKVSLHKFPDRQKYPQIHKQWLAVCNLNEIDTVSGLRICSSHFLKENLPMHYQHYNLALRNSAPIPSINVPNPDALVKQEKEESDDEVPTPHMSDEKPTADSTILQMEELSEYNDEVPTPHISDEKPTVDLTILKMEELLENNDEVPTHHTSDEQPIADLMMLQMRELSKIAEKITVKKLRNMDDVDDYFALLYNCIKEKKTCVTMTLQLGTDENIIPAATHDTSKSAEESNCLEMQTPRKTRTFFDPKHISEIQTPDVATPWRTSQMLHFIEEQDQVGAVKIMNLQANKRHLLKEKPKKEKVEIVEKTELSEYKKRLIEKRLQKRLEIENRIFKCRFCEVDLNGMESVVEHIKEEHLWTTRCILCPKILKRYDFVLLHLQAHARYGRICSPCHLFFKDKKSLEIHKESAEHKGPFLCNICNKTYKSHDRLKIHIEAMHGGNSTTKYKCSQCEYLTKWKNNLYNHMYTHQSWETRKRYLCQHCARGFTSSYSLKFHIRKVHEGQTHLRYNDRRTSLREPKPPPPSSYQCEICANIFKHECSFFTHRLTHPEASVNCPYCDRVLENPTEYKEHRRSEHNKFMCNVCEKRFPTKHQLAFHTSNFHVSKTYTCQECYAIFKSAQNYRQHILIHSDKRPHICEFCGQTFRQQAHKRTHINTVHGKKKFQCKVCGRVFAYESILRDHMRTHTGEKPFACLYCTKMFRDTVSRHKHVKNDHREKMEDFLIYKKKHQEEEVRKANNQEEAPDDLEETYSGDETATE